MAKINDENLLISIIIPVYNAEKYIEQCLNSIKNQTYNYFEVILVNDGSKDNSENICKNFLILMLDSDILLRNMEEFLLRETWDWITHKDTILHL